ncbi:hypothetical protein L596_006333 [Steinernema carpocapsae]|uniref:Uncharacterized protein n=1 Tax=Steinernema carpocapsae TaxID=34508 RepID=A0A4U8V1U6_STECR|nr:hypothetical protein L596_006333 [Steinernema carpocapsae]
MTFEVVCVVRMSNFELTGMRSISLRLFTDRSSLLNQDPLTIVSLNLSKNVVNCFCGFGVDLKVVNIHASLFDKAFDTTDPQQPTEPDHNPPRDNLQLAALFTQVMSEVMFWNETPIIKKAFHLGVSSTPIAPWIQFSIIQNIVLIIRVFSYVACGQKSIVSSKRKRLYSAPLHSMRRWRNPKEGSICYKCMFTTNEKRGIWKADLQFMFHAHGEMDA